jgi:hypothetical protein
MEIASHEFNSLAVCAFRYVLSRHTYMVSLISELILKNKERLEVSTKELLIRETSKYLETSEKGNIGAFAQIDIDCWNNFLIELVEGE